MFHALREIQSSVEELAPFTPPTRKFKCICDDELKCLVQGNQLPLYQVLGPQRWIFSHTHLYWCCLLSCIYVDCVTVNAPAFTYGPAQCFYPDYGFMLLTSFVWGVCVCVSVRVVCLYKLYVYCATILSMGRPSRSIDCTPNQNKGDIHGHCRCETRWARVSSFSNVFYLTEL